MPRGRLFSVVLVGVTLLLAGLILGDWLPALRGPAPGSREWHWPYDLRPPERWWGPLLAAAGVWLAGAWWLRQEQGTRPTALGLAGLALGSLMLQLGLVYAHRGAIAAELVDRTLANETSGYFAVAAETADLNSLLRRFPQVMPGLPSEHTRTHPPGLIVAQWLTIRAAAAAPSLAEPLARAVWPLRCTDLWLLDRPPAVAAALGVWAFLPLVAAALTVIPIYFLGRRLLEANAARLAAVLVAILPALLLFAPSPDQLFALLSAVTLLTWLVAVQRRSHHLAFLAGLLLSVSTFLSLGNLALLLIIAVLAARNWRQSQAAPIPSPQSPIPNPQSLVFFMAGLAAAWVVYWLGWGVAPWEVARTGLQQHYELVTSQRRYSWWLAYNLVDLFIFTGPAVVIAFAAAAAIAARRLAAGARLAADGLAFALALLIVALDLSGAARGEVGRLWLFFMPFVAIVAAGYLVSRPAGHRPALLLIAGQLALAVSLGLAWRPIEAVIVVAQRPEMAALSAPTNHAAVAFGDSMRLTGYDLDTSQATPGGSLGLTLFWQADGPAGRPYTVFTHLIDEQGVLVAQQDNWPVRGQWPPTCWRENETIVDLYTIQLAAELPGGSYGLLVGTYDARNGVRLLTADGRDSMLLATVTVAP